MSEEPSHVDETYVDEIAVFGDALTEAYKCESKMARDPRIILTDGAVKTIIKHLRYYGDYPRNVPQVRGVLKDSDGQWFLNYLDHVLLAESEQEPFYEEFLQHKLVVEEKLNQNKKCPYVWSMFAWVAGYHNYFCDIYSQHFNDEYRINIELFKAKPSQIV